MSEFKTILVTTDFSETSCKAIAPALLLARKLGAKIIVAHVSEPFMPFVGEHYVPVDLEAMNKSIQARAREDLEQFVAKHFGTDVVVEPATAIGVPHAEIVKLAQDHHADLVVMAMHGRGFVAHALLGSNTERVLRRAPCPVLVIPERP